MKEEKDTQYYGVTGTFYFKFEDIEKHIDIKECFNYKQVLELTQDNKLTFENRWFNIKKDDIGFKVIQDLYNFNKEMHGIELMQTVENYLLYTPLIDKTLYIYSQFEDEKEIPKEEVKEIVKENRYRSKTGIVPIYKGTALKNKKINTIKINDLWAQIAAAFEAMHKQNIVHIDVKTDNIIYHEPSSRYKLIDFERVERMLHGKCAPGTVAGIDNKYLIECPGTKLYSLPLISSDKTIDAHESLKMVDYLFDKNERQKYYTKLLYNVNCSGKLNNYHYITNLYKLNDYYGLLYSVFEVIERVLKENELYKDNEKIYTILVNETSHQNRELNIKRLAIIKSILNKNAGLLEVYKPQFKQIFNLFDAKFDELMKPFCSKETQTLIGGSRKCIDGRTRKVFRQKGHGNTLFIRYKNTIVKYADYKCKN